jgi:hypothetical protein
VTQDGAELLMDSEGRVAGVLGHGKPGTGEQPR